GVILGWLIPIRTAEERPDRPGLRKAVKGRLLAWLDPRPLPSPDRPSLGKRMIHDLHPWVAFLIMPLFAFANAGVSLHGLTMERLTDALPMGIACGLFFGKQIGIFLASWLIIRRGLAHMPARATWPEFYAVCMIAGIGFTMS